jgi:hypothetical protein
MTEARAAALAIVDIPRLSLSALRELRDLVRAHCVPSSTSTERLGRRQTMKGQQRRHSEQLDLPLSDKGRNEQRTLDPEIRREVAKLLSLLLDACVLTAAKTKGAGDEQDQQ